MHAFDAEMFIAGCIIVSFIISLTCRERDMKKQSVISLEFICERVHLRG